MRYLTIKSKSTFLLIAFAGLLAAGCGNQASIKLVGTWEMEINYVEFDTGNPDGMTLVFKSNGSLKTITRFFKGQSEKDWRWSLLSWDDVSASAVIRCQMSHEATETTVRFIDDNTIELVPPNIDVLQTRLRFVRK